MNCPTCRHPNPDDSAFCNQCGGRLGFGDEDTEETFLEGTVKDFTIPGSAAGRTVPIGQILYGSAASAEAAMAAVGAMAAPGLRTEFVVPGLGRIVRCFGVMRNNLDFEEVTDAGTNLDMLAFPPADLSRFHQAAVGAARRIERAIRTPDNERVLRKLEGGKLKYLPVNRVVAKRVEADLVDLGLHLPWSIGGIDVPFGERCRREFQGFGFVCYFGHLGRIEPINGEPGFRRTREIFSVPFGVDGFHTWEAPINDEILDEDVALVVEADAVA